MKQAEAIAKEKMKDLNAFDIKEALQIFVDQLDRWVLRLKNNYEKNQKDIEKF